MRVLHNQTGDDAATNYGRWDGGRPCPNCHETDQLRPIAGAWLRCAACQFLLPQPTPKHERESVSTAALGGFGPGVLLRERYRLAHLIGQGAHGKTYLAEHEFLGHPCVVKALPYRITNSSDAAVKRLRTEAAAGFRINDNHVVRVLDFDAFEGIWYFVMEYVEGLDLASIASSGLVMDWRQVVGLATEAALGLSAIHQGGMVHRDIKPSNLILGADGRLRIADLGVVDLVQTQQGDFELNNRSEPVGTLGYAAPEVFEEGSVVDGRADLFSLGATLFELLTGQPLRATGSIYEVMLGATQTQIEWPREAEGRVPSWLVRGVTRLLEPDADDRFTAPAEFLRFLQAPTAATPQRPPVLVERPEPRGLAILAFQNRNDDDGNDWVGHAAADHLGRAIAQLPDAYVVDRNQFQETLKRVHPEDSEDRLRDLQRAARLHGAAAVVEGDFAVSEGEVSFRLHVHAGGLTRPVASASGPLADLAQLEATLLEQLAAELGLAAQESKSSAATASAALAAQERFFAGRRAFFRGDYEAARELGQEAIGLDPGFIEALGFVGVCCARMGRYDEAEHFNARQERLADERSDERSRVEAFANRATMNYFRGDYEEAERAFLQATEIADALGLASEVALIKNNMGFVQLQLGLVDEAAVTFAEAIETHRGYGDLVSLVAPYNGMGNVLRAQQRYDEARGYFERAMTLAQESDDLVNVGVGYMNLGQCALLLGRLSDAKHELARALGLLEDTKFYNGLARVYEYMADLNMQLGNAAEAARCAERRIDLAARHNNLRMQAAAWKQKAGALRLLGRSADAAACEQRAEEAQAEWKRASRSA